VISPLHTLGMFTRFNTMQMQVGIACRRFRVISPLPTLGIFTHLNTIECKWVWHTQVFVIFL